MIRYQFLLRHKVLFMLFLVLTFAACERITETLEPVTYEYFPLETGKYKIYKIDSTVYDEYNCTVQTISYEVKELIGALGYDGENAPFYTIKRYLRPDSTKKWVLYNIWTVKNEHNQIERVEDNQRIVKLVFPIKENQHWNGITFIRRDTLVPIRGGSIDMYKDWDKFVYKNVGELFYDTISNKAYPETVEVLQVDKTNNIERRFSKEIYAKNIGLVYKEMWILDTQCRSNCIGVGNIATCIFTPWQYKAEKGFILTETLIDYN